MTAVVVAALFTLVSSCASVAQPSFLVKLDQQPEKAPLPPTPQEDPLKDQAGNAVPPDEWVESYEPAQCLTADGRVANPNAPRPCPNANLRPGILMSEARAFRAGRTTIRYAELRSMYEADRAVWAVQRMLYEGQLQRADAHIKTLAPTWWERNAFVVGGIGGFVLGALIVTGVAVGLHAVP